jgi:hypothetical protein
MILKKLGAVSLLAMSSLSALPASAQMYSGSNTFKTINPTTNQPIVFVGEQSPGGEVSVTFVGADRTRRVSANACGLITLKDTTSAPLAGLKTVDGAVVNQATLPVRLIPRCVNGVLEEPRTADFKTGLGDVVLVKTPNTSYEAVLEEPRTADFKTGLGDVVLVKTPNTSYEAVYTADVVRKVRANACGFASVRGSAASPLLETTSIKIGNGTTTTINAIATAPSEPVCRNGVLYTPTSWMIIN